MLLWGVLFRVLLCSVLLFVLGSACSCLFCKFCISVLLSFLSVCPFNSWEDTHQYSEQWVVAKWTMSWIQAVKISFLCRAAGVCLGDRSCHPRETRSRTGLRKEPVEVVRAPDQDATGGHFPREVSLAHPTGRRPWGRPRTRRKDYISTLVWEHLGISQSELAHVDWGSLLELLLPWFWRF